MDIVREYGYARLGLLGNPSDGYGGKTISLLIRDYFAQVILYEWEEFELVLSQQDHCRFDSIDGLIQDVRTQGYYGGIRLVKAAVKKFFDFCRRMSAEGVPGYELHDRKFSVRYESNIPRAVGLAGSSAIIVATMRALMRFYGISIPLPLLPTLILSVEAEELRIAAGLQDRVIQSYGGLVYMDFHPRSQKFLHGMTHGRYEPLPLDRTPPLYVAFAADAGEPTEIFHNNLRARYELKDREVVDAMVKFARFAEEGRTAILSGDHVRLHALMNENFDLRRSLVKLPPRHVAMVEAARAVGVSAKFAGSGGAIVGTYPNEETFLALKERLAALPGCPCRVFKPTPATLESL